ncbi:putative wing apart-like protein [Lupinus albus]|uniref:Putative wing apart-like protein n=1 Tax=Lupinus albus TaxID=3870 RepID=A0A6A4NRD9_LUPAL|nr:putative wing apart-like protein [Lupinus albus]
MMATSFDDFCNRKRKRAKKNVAISFLDGIRKGQPLRIIRATLLSLLSIYSDPHRRHLLTAEGMAKTIIDAILGLTLDDSPSNLGAVTLFYILTSEGQDVHLLESPGCIRFLIKLLKPFVSKASEDKESTFGFKLLALSKNASMYRNTEERLDSSSVAIFYRVQEILVNCKELKSTCPNGNEVERPELCPKWIALLTIEKACLPAISLDDGGGLCSERSATLRNTGGKFKEKLRVLGVLNAVFEIAMSCLSDLECWMEDSSLSTKDLRNDIPLKSLTLHLKCLKIMENAAFLSKDNQTHLLGLKGKPSPLAIPFSFVELLITVIKILPDLCSRWSHSALSNDNKPVDTFSTGSQCSESDQFTDYEENETGMYYDMERASSVNSLNLPQKSQLTTSTSTSYGQTNARASCRFCSAASMRSNDSHDPFAFDEVDIASSEWDRLSWNPKKSRFKKTDVTNREFEAGCQSQTNVRRQESSNGDVNCSSPYLCDEERCSLVTDCFLTSVKVLINLTNDNPVGCRQVAAYGGLEIMPLLIVVNFPYYSQSPLSFSQTKGNTSKIGNAKDHRHDRHLTDHELDFLVALLGLLVNLVEKDGKNRSRLAAARVLLPASEGLWQEVKMGVIELLCSIFLANQGGGEEADKHEHMLLNDEAAFLQGEKEAGKMIVEAYSALLLAFLSTESESIREAIAENLPHHNLSILVPVLDRFVEFHLALNMISPETHEAVSGVIETCRVP